jgi:hypothetical protein
MALMCDQDILPLTGPSYAGRKRKQHQRIGWLLDEALEDLRRRNTKAAIPIVVPVDVRQSDEVVLLIAFCRPETFL